MTLAILKCARVQLERQADQVRAVFVTVDPERDSAERIKAYLSAFDSIFIGVPDVRHLLTEKQKFRSEI
jgi:protein SCO1/2